MLPRHGLLPPPRKVKATRVWGDVDGKMVSAGIVKCPSRNPLQEIKFIRKASSLNITLEPESGSKEPTVAQLQANGLVASN
ncbi:MAG: anti-sigma factor [Saprospirales bacterium]|nr:anti-sigma factor [Saprospirales bacterium]